jgi:hypothetical protein
VKRAAFYLVVAFALALGFQNVSAQGRVHFVAGVNVSYAALDSLNFVIDQFNLDNPTYPNQLNNLYVPMGVFVAAGGNFSRVLIELDFTMRSAATSARSTEDASGNQQRVLLRYNAHTFDVGIGYFFVDKDYSQFAFGTSLDFGQTRVLARRGSSQQVANFPWSRLVNELNLSATVFLQGMVTFRDNPKLGIFFRPYYQFGFVKNDFGQVNRFLRPNNWQADPFFILSRPSNVGLKVGVFLGS